MKQSNVRTGHPAIIAFAVLLCVLLAGCGGQGGNGGGGGGGGKNLNPPVTGLTATAGNGQVTLNWNPYAGATSYNVARSTTSGGECPTGCNYITNPLNPPTSTSYTDPGLANGTAYYYQVNANYSAGLSGLSNEASATPSGSTTNIAVTLDWLANAHPIGQAVYGGAFPKDASTISDSLQNSFVRWGGNATSTYNWQLGTYNADNDYFFEDFGFCGLGGGTSNGPCADSDSTQFVKDVAAAGAIPLMTIPMLPWVAQSAEGNNNQHWTFSVLRDGLQCHTDPYNPDAGDGIVQTANCDSQPTYLTATSGDLNDAYVPLLDDHSQPCASGNCVYRSDWVAALATAFGNSHQNFYDMDNEIDIWGGTHRDIHPNPSGYDELSNIFLTEAAKLKGWDPKAVRLGPVSCCWWFYWNGANNNDKAAHAGIDFLPWWLNQIYWQDQISGARSLDMFDIHAYPDATTTDNSGNPLPKSQLQALATSIYRDYWDPTFVSPSGTINQPYATNIQPNKTIAFRIPRLRALVNSIYPGTPLAITEWSAAFAGESDFSTALSDADAYGILGRENVSLATRWTAPNPANPNYWALKLYTNADGHHGGFNAGTSISATNNGNPNLFSSYASASIYIVDGVASGSTLNVMLINKDPQNSAQVQITLKNFNASSFTSYSLISQSPTTLITSGSHPWSSTFNLNPYSMELISISGTPTITPIVSWSLSPDTIMIPAGGSAKLQVIGGQPANNALFTVTLNSAVFDAYEGAAACGGNIVLTTPTITNSQSGALTVNAGNTPGFCHFTVSGTDNNGVTQTQGGWIVVGNPPASLTITAGNNQTAGRGTTLPAPLAVNLSPGSSGGANPASGASIFFTTNAGSLSNGTSSGSKVLATTDSSGSASVTLTLPAGAQAVTVTAEGPYGLGHPIATFNETSQ